jgi:hypothetical protein
MEWQRVRSACVQAPKLSASRFWSLMSRPRDWISLMSTLNDSGVPACEGVVTLDERLVDLGAALHVVGLDGEQFLQRVRGAVGLEGPDFHFAEALAAVLGLAAQRLLGDERVRTDRAGVDLVRHKMVQLHHVDVADDDLLIDFLAGAAVEQSDSCQMSGSLASLRYSRTFFSGMPSNTGVATLMPSFLQAQPRCVSSTWPDVHARRHAERVEADFDRRTVGQEGHVFLGHDLGDDALVAVTAGHLVTDLELLLRGDVDLDLLDRAIGRAFAGLDGAELALAVALELVKLRLVASR